MRKRLVRILTVPIIFVLFNLSVHAGHASAQDNKNFLWKVQSETGTAYILGSIHVMKKESYPLNKKIEDAFDRSNSLAVEININDIKEKDIPKLMESAIYHGNDTIEKHISSETYELLKKEISVSGIPLELISKQKPWLAALSLMSVKLLKLGFDPSLGIDMHFLSKSSEKKVIELESLESQMDLFSGFSEQEQELFLLYTLKEMEKIGPYVDRLVRAWKSGDTGDMEMMILKDLKKDKKLSSVYNKILFTRNKNMTSKIEGFLKKGGTYFVVVGAAHLIGENGIIELLWDKGYIVDQM